jgi:outer membrane immunogenic protein
MKKLFLGTVALTVLATAASAADMAPSYAKAPPMAAPIYNWTGFYIGLNAGAASSDVNFDVKAAAAPPFAFDAHRFSDQSRKTGWLAGGQVGYNWQTGMTVLGIEADAQWVGNRVTSDTIFDPFFHGKGRASFSSNVEWLATLRGRVGIAATPALLLYVTGGVAFAGINVRYQNAGFGAAFNAPLINTYSATDTRVGWTAGFGAEYALGGNWSVKAEYLRVGFDDHSLTVPFVGPQPTPLSGSVRVNQDIDILRAGINYKFGGPIVAKY